MWGRKEEIQKGSDDVTKTRFVKLCDWLAYPERKDEKSSLARNQPVGANWREDTSRVIL